MITGCLESIHESLLHWFHFLKTLTQGEIPEWILNHVTFPSSDIAASTESENTDRNTIGFQNRKIAIKCDTHLVFLSLLSVESQTCNCWNVCSRSVFLDEELSVVDVEEVFGFVKLSNPCFLDPNVTLSIWNFRSSTWKWWSRVTVLRQRESNSHFITERRTWYFETTSDPDWDPNRSYDRVQIWIL